MQPEAKGLFNVSYFEKEVNEEIIRMVGRPYSFLKSIKIGGSGSPRMIINEASSGFHYWMEADKYMQYCNIELRPGGIIIRFRSRLEALAFVISTEDLTLKRGEDVYEIGNGKEYVILTPFKNKKQVRAFFRKIMDR